MILNGYTILGLFLCLIRLLLGVFLFVSALGLWRLRSSRNRSDSGEQDDARFYLATIVASVVFILNITSWPILYAVLQSYVHEWPSVMCIYGVMKIGADSQSASRFLPSLWTWLQVLRPLLVFVSGSVFILYVINRRTQTGAIRRRVLAGLILMGALTSADAACECAALVIPKKNVHVEAGCCTTSSGDSGTVGILAPQYRLTASHRTGLAIAYYGSNIAMIAWLFFWLRKKNSKLSRGQWGMTMILWGATIPISGLFLAKVAAPGILGLPFHSCPYDLINVAPESIVGVGLFFFGCFSTGWGFVAFTAGNTGETRGFLSGLVGRQLFFGFFGYAASLLHVAMQLWLS